MTKSEIANYLNLNIIGGNGWHSYSNIYMINEKIPELYTLVENEKLEIILSKIKSMNLEYTRHPSMFQNKTALFVKSNDVLNYINSELRNDRINKILNG